MHKTANVLNKLPKGVHPRAKQHLQDIWMPVGMGHFSGAPHRELPAPYVELGH